MTRLTILLGALVFLHVGCALTPTNKSLSQPSLKAVKEPLVIEAMAITGLMTPTYKLLITLDPSDDSNGIEDNGQQKVHIRHERVLAIQNALGEARFFDLPTIVAENHPCYQDGYDLFLDITVNGQKHSTALCDPQLALDDPEIKRFLIVWNVLWTGYKDVPKW